MLRPKRALTSMAALLGLAITIQPLLGQAKSITGELVVVPPNKLPEQAHQAGQAMNLHLVNPTTLYLYIEEQDGKQLAVYDVSDPQKMKFKNLVQINAPVSFDFVQIAGPSLELIRFRDGRGDAIVDMSRPKSPTLKALGSAVNESYIVPVQGVGYDVGHPVTSHDYQVFSSSGSEPVMTFKAVIQQEANSNNGTMYLLGQDGLTVIRNIKSERKLAATVPAWTNTIDDN